MLENKHHQNQKGGQGVKYEEAQYQALIALMQEIRKKWRLEPWNVLGAEEVLQEPADPEPGPGQFFDWKRLAQQGFSLVPELQGVDGESQAAQCPKQELEDQKLKEWGYAFGPTEKGVRQMFLAKRKAAFRHRYGIYEHAPILSAVESLLEQRHKAAGVLRDGSDDGISS